MRLVVRIHTVAFEGITIKPVEVQVQIASGLPAFTLVGLADKAVTEAKERVRAAVTSLGLAMPAKRITVNLAPADLPKEGSHYDLPIVLGLMAAMGAIDPVDVQGPIVMGELALDGALAPVPGVLPAGLFASEQDVGLICPAENGAEAIWASPDLQIIAAPSLRAALDHLKGDTPCALPDVNGALKSAAQADGPLDRFDMRDVKGQESAKRALEVAAAGGHNMLMVGPPGAGKSMLAARLPTILPPLSPREALDLAMIRSLAGAEDGAVMQQARPFRNPHHSASMAALIGGGQRAKPGEVSLAHCGVLFLDELPEFARPVLDALRQPLETAQAVIARANRHVTYPADVQLIAAMNPCRCGYMGDPSRACSRVPRCGEDYQAKLSGPLLDRIDIRIDVPPVRPRDLALPEAKEGSAEIRDRVIRARQMQDARYQDLSIRTNAQADTQILTERGHIAANAMELALDAADKFGLSARGFVRVLRVARSIADLAGRDDVSKIDMGEALSLRRAM